MSKWTLYWWLIKAKFNANRPYSTGVLVIALVAILAGAYYLLK